MEERKVVYDDEIDLYELFIKLWKHKIFILIFTLLCTVASIVAVNIMPPKYKVTAQVVPNNNEFLKIFFRDMRQYSDIKLVMSDIKLDAYTAMIGPLFQSRDLSLRAINGAIAGNRNYEHSENIINELSINVERDKQNSNVIKLEVVYGNADLAYRFANNLLILVDDELKKIYKINDSETHLLKVTESPVMPKKPYSPKRSLVVAVAFVSSLFLALFLALIIDWIGAVRKQYSPDRM